MTTTTDTTTALVRFLLARLDEDKSALAKLSRKAAGSEAVDSVTSLERLKVDCASKRVMIGSLQQLLALRDLPAEKNVRDGASSVLRAMALPYAGHRAYRAEWHVAIR